LKAWRTTMLGDDLYFHQPFREQVLARGCAFILVCLPGSHTRLHEWAADFARTGEIAILVKTRWNGKNRLTDTYRWLNDLPLRDGDDALTVCLCALGTTDAEGNVLSRNAGSNSMRIPKENVVEIVIAGRSRWNIENENNNTLEVKGYRFERKHSHGKQHLANLLASLILPACLAHTLLDPYDPRHRHVRVNRPSRHIFPNDFRALYCAFDSWERLLDSMIEDVQPARPPPSPAVTSRRSKLEIPGRALEPSYGPGEQPVGLSLSARCYAKMETFDRVKSPGFRLEAVKTVIPCPLCSVVYESPTSC
jgi:hypothetical protein